MTVTPDDTQQLYLVDTDDGRSLAIPYQAIASWKALLGLTSYEMALTAIIERTRPDAEPIDWQDKYATLANRPDPVTVAQPRMARMARMARMRSAAIPEESVLAGQYDRLAALERTFVSQVKGGKTNEQSRD